MENQYVAVFGNVRHFQNKRSINAFKVRRIADANEITTHLLEVIQAHLAVSKGASVSGHFAL